MSIKFTEDEADLRALTPAMRASLTYVITFGNNHGASSINEALDAVDTYGNRAYLPDVSFRGGDVFHPFTLVSRCVVNVK